MLPSLKTAGLLAGGALAALGALAAAGVGWVKLTSPVLADHSAVPYPQLAVSHDADTIERGRYLVRAVAHCDHCHGDIPEGQFAALAERDIPLSGGAAIPLPFGVFRPINLTPDPATGIGAWTDAELARGIRHAVDRHGRIAPFMRVVVPPIADPDLAAIIAYLRAQEPVVHQVAPSQPFFALEAMAAVGNIGPLDHEIPAFVPPADQPSVDRGRYLATGPAGCQQCHTTTDPLQGFAFTSPPFSGGDVHVSPIDPAFGIIAPNLTPHPTGRAGQLTEDGFVARMQAGRTFPDSIMPWEAFGKLTESDLRSIYRFLRTVEPVDHDVGPTRFRL